MLLIHQIWDPVVAALTWTDGKGRCSPCTALAIMEQLTSTSEAVLSETLSFSIILANKHQLVGL